MKLANVYGVVGFEGQLDDFLEWAVTEMGAVCVESDEQWQALKELYRGVHFPDRDRLRPGRLQPGTELCLQKDTDSGQ